MALEWGKVRGGQKSGKSIPNLGVNEFGNLQQETQQEEGRSRTRVDGFEMLKKVPVFTGSEDVEEWLWKIGFLVDKFQNREEELIDGLRYRLAEKAAQFFRVEGGCLENFEDQRVLHVYGEISGRGCSDSGNGLPSVSAKPMGISSRLRTKV